MISNKQLAEWRAKTDAATEGPWNDCGERGVTQTRHITRDVWTIPRIIEDVTFIAITREAMPALLDEVERLRAVTSKAIDERNKYHERLDAIGEGVGLIDGLVKHCACPEVAKEAIS